MTTLKRWLAHLNFSRRKLHRAFPKQTLDAIERAVRVCESQHAGEIRFVVEAALSLEALVQVQSPRQRAIEVFSQARVWDTEHNNGVLIYVLLADRDVEIVADRGVAGGTIPQQDWEQACRTMETHFREQRFEQGAIAGVEAVAAILAQHPPRTAHWRNDLPDAPLILP